MQASTATYRKIEIAANSNPGNILGDGSDGMPLQPKGFVELSGFQGEYYSLDMCIDEKLTDNKFRLIYDSDPDGEFITDDLAEDKAS